MKIKTLNRIRAAALCSSRVLAVAAYIAIAYAVVSMAGCDRDPGGPSRHGYYCQFDRIGGLYFIEPAEFDRISSLVTVHGAEPDQRHRTFMFQRSQLSQCETSESRMGETVDQTEGAIQAARDVLAVDCAAKQGRLVEMCESLQEAAKKVLSDRGIQVDQ